VSVAYPTAAYFSIQQNNVSNRTINNSQQYHQYFTTIKNRTCSNNTI